MRLAWLFALAACSAARSPGASPATGNEAPPWFVGAWKREWIQELGGSPKDEKFVRDLQTPSIFGSVRIPKARPAFGTAASFADLDDSQLAALLEQNGFSGVATFAGDLATWNHDIDFQPPGEPDVGRLRHAGPTTVIEEAPDRSYTELWWSMTTGDGKYLGLKVMRGTRVEKILTVVGDQFVFARNRARDLPQADSLAELVILTVVGDQFVFARNRARDLPQADSLVELVAKTHPSRDQLVEILDCEFSYGIVHGGRVPWEVRFSTLPWREGKSLAFIDDVTIDGGGAPKPRTPVAGESWTAPVNTFARDDLKALFPR
jgi:hypothetical protein